MFCFGNVALKKSGNVVSLEDSQSHQDNQALPVGWHFHNAVASVRRRDGIDPFGMLTGKIRQLQIATAGIRGRYDFAGQVARIIIVPPMLGYFGSLLN